jgi:hypothetical protein
MNHSDLAESTGHHAASEAVGRGRPPSPTGRTSRLHLTGLHREHQPLIVVNLHIEDVHAGNIEDGIGPAAPGAHRTHT